MPEQCTVMRQEAAPRSLAAQPVAALRPAPVNILFIIDELRMAGGAERHLLKLIRLLPPERYRCSLLTFAINRSGIFADIPCPVYVFPLRCTYDLRAAEVALNLRRLLKNERISIVHTFFETSDLWAGVLARAFGVPVLVSSRRDMGVFRSAKHRLAYKATSRLYDAILTVSEKVHSHCVRNDHISPAKVVTHYNGVDLDQVAQAKDPHVTRASLGVAHSAPLIATVAHIREVKGIDVLVRAASLVRERFPDATFVVVGDVHEEEKKYFDHVRGLCRQLKLEGTVKLIGSSESIAAILKLADVFCLPSRSEGFSNALIEAMACGLPCVATRVGGNDEVISDGINGYLAESEAFAAVADRICALLESPERAAQMGQAGRSLVAAKFTDEAMTTQLVEIYDRLLEAKHV